MFEPFASPTPKKLKPEAQGLSLRPEVFFRPPWRGTGLICDGFGLPKERYLLSGKGGTDAQGNAVIEQRLELESGAAEAHEWVFDAPDGDLIRAVDRLTGKELKGTMTPRGFRWTYPATIPTPFGRRRCRVEIDFVLKSPQEASTSSTMSLFGVTISTSSSHIRHDALAEGSPAEALN